MGRRPLAPDTLVAWSAREGPPLSPRRTSAPTPAAATATTTKTAPPSNRRLRREARRAALVRAVACWRRRWSACWRRSVREGVRRLVVLGAIPPILTLIPVIWPGVGCGGSRVG